MIFGTPVSGFEKKVKKLFRRRCWRFSNMRSLELKSLVAAAKRPVGKGRDDKCLVRSRSRVTGVALEWHQLRYLILEARRLVRGAALKLNNSICPVALHRWNLQSDRPANRVRKTRKASAGLGLVRIPDPPESRSVGGRKPSFSPPPFLRLRSGSCSTHDVENVFQFSVDPVAMPK